MHEWKPNEELINLLEILIDESESSDELSITVGDKTYTVEEELEEVKKGTSLGRQIQDGYLKLRKMYESHECKDSP